MHAWLSTLQDDSGFPHPLGDLELVMLYSIFDFTLDALLIVIVSYCILFL